MRLRAGLFACVLCLSSAPIASAQSIELILDASGSMNAPLDASTTRIAAARQALEEVVTSLPSNSVISLRAYGHRSPREKHDCDDTAMLVPFTPAASARAAILAAARSIKVQGYTPISRVLRIAATDLSAAPGADRMIILISDGKETCDADPCATAAALRTADAKLVIHTVGLGVDAAARNELQCVAHAGGGKYFDARSASELVSAIRSATVTKAAIPAPVKKGTGKLQISATGSLGSYPVRDAAGRQLRMLTPAEKVVDLPAGLYSVGFGKEQWRGIEVRAGQTTTISPALIVVSGLPMLGNATIVDPETRATVAKLNAMDARVALLPGTYTVMLGRAEWGLVQADAGETVTLEAARLKVTNVSGSAKITDASGNVVATVDPVNHTVGLPPGTYSVQLRSGPRKVTVKAGERLELDAGS